MPPATSHSRSNPIARLRSELGVTQAVVAEKAGLDQSRVSRIEKGEVVDPIEVERLLDGLRLLGSQKAAAFKEFSAREWQHIEPPSFWNPQREYLETAEETLDTIRPFLEDQDKPWPLRRHIERHREVLVKAATFLTRLNHNVAFIGDLGVGKSTFISFVFDLLVPASANMKNINRPVLETGAGGTTICEVHVRKGPEFGISLVPMTDRELHQLVSDFCAAKWALKGAEQRGTENESIGVSRETERAIRNMSGLVRRREITGGKPTYHDPVQDLARSCASEDEFRTQVLGLMQLPERTRRELWYESSSRKDPMEWVSETFRAVNNGRMKDVSLPRSIDLLVPDFSDSFGELEITVIDTKGVDDVAVREDLDLRLRDPRSAIVFCSRFNDAPGNTARALLQHMHETFSERVDTGKVSILALPRAEEARAMKDDSGERALSDAEGYEFKGLQVASELAAQDLAGVPMFFFNVETDDPAELRGKLLSQLMRMRTIMADKMLDLCAAVDDIMKNHEAHALNAAIEEVANRLSTFLHGNRSLGARERLAQQEAINTVKTIRYASTLWASARRSGEYSGLNIVHQVGVGAARDARARSDTWFDALTAFLNSLKADQGLTLAQKTIEQIGRSATATKTEFLEAAQRAGMEVYHAPLTQASVWTKCASEWGQGSGFKYRVADHLEKWFETNPKLKERLEEIVCGLWEQLVISPLLRLADESAPEDSRTAGAVIEFPRQATA